MIYEGHPHQKFGPTTYSQHGEDLFLMNLIQLLGLNKPSYLDLGAHHPVHISNTALLYQNGSRGVNVEANQLLMAEFYKQRPEDKNINCAVATQNCIAPFFMESDHSVLNSLDPNYCRQHNVEYSKQQEVQCYTLHKLVDKCCDGIFPDILLTDIEGLDLEVLATTDFEDSKPRIIMTEINHSEATLAIDILARKGFNFLCRIVSNMVFIDKFYSHRTHR